VKTIILKPALFATRDVSKRSNRLSIALLLFVVALVGGCSGGSTPEETEVIVLPVLRGLTPNLPQADATFDGQHFSGSGVCAECHDDDENAIDPLMVVNEDSGPRDVSINRAWRTSIMANSTRDPYWHAVVASELRRFPMLADEINDTCTRCHAPMANDFAKKENLPLQVFDSGSVETGDFVQGIYSMDSTNEMYNHAMDGVSCTLCHQMADDGNLGTDIGMSGGWVVNEFPIENKSDRPAYGQYADPSFAYMQEQSGYLAQYGAHISSSETCGSCHNLQTNPVDKDGNPVPGVSHFAEQMVYTEWQNSIFDDAGSEPRSCQSCHMPKVNEPITFATAGGAEPRNDFAEHTFLGANTVMQDMLKNFKTELGVDADITDEDFDESIARNREFLKTSASIELTEQGIVDDVMSVDVTLTNLSGHKFPTGYHTRRAYLHVLVVDATGMLVYENGLINADGSIQGVLEDSSQDSYETHYDVITSPTQVQVYQAITGDAEGNQTHSLLTATQFLKDNRLTPLGFDKNAVSDDIGVYGDARYDQDFNNGKDTVTYQIPATGTAPYSVLVELRYQPMSFGALQTLFAESDKLDQVDMFRTIYDATTLRDEVIATDIISVQ